VLEIVQTNLGPSRKTLRPSWCPKLVTELRLLQWTCLLFVRRNPFQREISSFITTGSQNRGRNSQPAVGC